MEKLHLYLHGQEFDLITDNKAVELRNDMSKPKARIERWCLRIQPYRYKVVHKAGKMNIANFLSRKPIKIDKSETYHE